MGSHVWSSLHGIIVRNQIIMICCGSLISIGSDSWIVMDSVKTRKLNFGGPVYFGSYYYYYEGINCTLKDHLNWPKIGWKIKDNFFQFSPKANLLYLADVGTSQKTEIRIFGFNRKHHYSWIDIMTRFKSPGFGSWNPFWLVRFAITDFSATLTRMFWRKNANSHNHQNAK